MGKDNLKDSVNELLKGMDGFVSSKTTVGEAIRVNDTIILPLSEVRLGVGAGTYSGKSTGAAGGMGATMTPSCVIVIDENGARLIRVTAEDKTTKIIDMIPEVIGKIREKFIKNDPEVDRKIKKLKKSRLKKTEDNENVFVPEKCEAEADGK